VPETSTRLSILMARLKPICGSNGDPETARWRSTRVDATARNSEVGGGLQVACSAL
jgi:hypothetical protein